MPYAEPPATRKKLLFLCQTLPFPPDGGVHIRSYHLLRILAEEYQVTALCFYRKAVRPTIEAVEASLAGLGRHAEAEAYPIPQEHNRIRWWWDHLRSVLTNRPYTVFTYQSSEMERRITELLETEEFDLVHMDSLDLVHYLPRIHHLPVVCDHHNVESELLERRAQLQDSLAVRRYMQLQARLTRAEEARVIPSLPLNITCSPIDAQTLRTLAPGSSVASIPNGVDVHAFSPDIVRRGRGIVFVGGYTWFPNRDGMDWFASEVLPIVRRELPETPLTWVGRMPDEVRASFSDRFGVHVTGYVDDVRPYVQGAACFIVPLRVGGGTRLKVLDAWAMGKAVVSTAVGCEGLQARDLDNILVADSAEDFAAAVKAVLKDETLQHRLGQRARETAEQYYDWDIIGRSLLACYRALTNKADSVGPWPTTTPDPS